MTGRVPFSSPPISSPKSSMVSPFLLFDAITARHCHRSDDRSPSFFRSYFGALSLSFPAKSPVFWFQLGYSNFLSFSLSLSDTGRLGCIFGLPHPRVSFSLRALLFFLVFNLRLVSQGKFFFFSQHYRNYDSRIHPPFSSRPAGEKLPPSRRI